MEMKRTQTRISSISLLLLVLLVAMLLASCGGASGETGESATNSFVGDWEVVHGNGWGGQIEAGNLVVFRPDGTMNAGKDAGRYEVQEDGRARVLLPDETVFAYPPVGGELRLEREIYGIIQAATLRPYEELPITRENLIGTWDMDDHTHSSGSYHPSEITFTSDGVESENCEQDETNVAVLWCTDSTEPWKKDKSRKEIVGLTRNILYMASTFDDPVPYARIAP
jgi:predicted small secreted protein